MISMKQNHCMHKHITKDITGPLQANNQSMILIFYLEDCISK